jgi:DNA repair exonuclease SbcCD ATPase subunit
MPPSKTWIWVRQEQLEQEQLALARLASHIQSLKGLREQYCQQLTTMAESPAWGTVAGERLQAGFWAHEELVQRVRELDRRLEQALRSEREQMRRVEEAERALDVVKTLWDRFEQERVRQHAVRWDRQLHDWTVLRAQTELTPWSRPR